SLYYNVRIGSSSAAIDIMAPMADLTSGYRTIPAIGNAYCNTFVLIKNLIPGETYYWSVQGIDQSLKGGEWAEEDSFVVSYVRAGFSADTVCFGSESNFIDLTLNSGDTISTWKWEFGDGDTSSIQNPSHLYASADTFAVRLIVSSIQESDTITQNVIVKPGPVAGFMTETVCHGDHTDLSNQSNLKGLETVYWSWDFGDGQTSQEANPDPHYYAQAGSYSVQLKVFAENGCSDSISMEAVVAQYPVVIVTASGSVNICEGESVLLSIENNEDYAYQWKLDDVPLSDSTRNKCMAIYKGAYSVDVTNLVAGCVSNSSNVDIVIEDVPASPIIEYLGDQSFCKGDSLVLNVPRVEEIIYKWKINDIVSTIGGNTFSAKNSGRYSIELENNYGCTSNSVNSVEVEVNEFPDRLAISSSGYDIDDCPEANVVTLTLNNAHTQYHYQWRLDEKNIQEKTDYFLQDYLAEGDYSALIENNGCFNESEVFTLKYNTELLDKPTILAEGPNLWYLACSNDSAPDYKWFYNDIEIRGENNYLYVAGDKYGKYSVGISETGRCYSMSDPVLIPDETTGMIQNPWANLKIYPNPTPGLFTLEMDNPIMGELNINIMNERGSQVLNIKFLKEMNHFKTQIDLSGQPAEVYIIGLILDEYRVNKRLIVE
nr:PKD domain-containing protein [Bacteroidales bacterium]